MDQTLTLREAADRLGVSHTALKRLIRSGALPEASKVKTETGRMWMIPRAALADIAAREGLVVDLTAEAPALDLTEPAASGAGVDADVPPERHPLDGAADHPVADPTPPTTQDVEPDHPSFGGGLHAAAEPPAAELDPSLAKVIDMPRSDDRMPTLAEVIDVALLDRLLTTQQEAAMATADAQRLQQEVETQAVRRVEVEEQLQRANDERVLSDGRYQEERLARSVSDARTAELRDRVAREMSIADAERQVAREATLARLRAEREAAQALGAMGWRARRRYQKRVSTS